MRYSIENELIRLTVDSVGAEAVSVIDKKTGTEMLWCGDPDVWGRHSPVLFPYTGRLTGGCFTVGSETYQGGQHGFARDFEHVLKEQTDTSLTLELSSSEKTRALWPFDFTLTARYTLDGARVHHAITVKNTGSEDMQFGLGFHPAYAVPFDDAHTYTDYDLVFDQLESPLCISTAAGGLTCGGSDYYLARNTTRIPLTDTLFASDSHCMTGLRSKTLSLVERDTGRSIRVNIDGFPFVLIWSTPTLPMRFVCIEPWHSLPGEKDGPSAWADKPCAARLAPGEAWETTLETTFDRVK